MLKFKIDENLPVEAALLLSNAGHDAVPVLHQHLGGYPDFEIAAICKDERRAIVTLDLDFADIRVYSPVEYSGIIVLRLNSINKYLVLDVLKRLLPLLDQETLSGKLWIVDESRVRIRG